MTDTRTDPLADVRAEAAAIVSTAEQEAAEATALIEALEERIRDDDDTVTPEELASARELGRFARLRAEAAKRRAAKAKQAERLRLCTELRAEIEAAATGAGARFVELLTAVEDAVTAFITAVDQRNAHLRAWRQRMHELGVPEHRNPLIPPAEHGHLGHNSTNAEVTAGRRRMHPLEPDHSLSAALRRVIDEANRNHRAGRGSQLQLDVHKVAHWIDPFEELAKIDTPYEEPPGLRFFRGANGAEISMDREPTDDERRHLVEITRAEAWGA